MDTKDHVNRDTNEVIEELIESLLQAYRKRQQEKERTPQQLENVQKQLGQHLMKEWGIEDPDKAKKIISQLKDQAIEIKKQIELEQKKDKSNVQENEVKSNFLKTNLAQKLLTRVQEKPEFLKQLLNVFDRLKERQFEEKLINTRAKIEALQARYELQGGRFQSELGRLSEMKNTIEAKLANVKGQGLDVTQQNNKTQTQEAVKQPEPVTKKQEPEKEQNQTVKTPGNEQEPDKQKDQNKQLDQEQTKEKEQTKDKQRTPEPELSR